MSVRSFSPWRVKTSAVGDSGDVTGLMLTVSSKSAIEE